MSKSKSTSTPAPYKPAQPLINKALKDSSKFYKQGVGSKIFTKPLVSPLADQTKQAYDGASGLANQNAGSSGMGGALQGILNNGGFNSQQQNSLDNWQKTANSSYDQNADPGFQGILAKAQNDARNQVGLSASAAGRYGSGIAQGAVAREVGNVTNNMLSNDYQNFKQRQDSANQNLFNGAQAGIGNMASAYDTANNPYQTLERVGAGYQSQLEKLRADQKRLFDEQQQNKWTQAQKLMTMGTATNPFASNTSTQPGKNPLLEGIGGVASIANLLL